MARTIKRVPIENAREMKDAMEKAGKPVEYMTKPKEGHGFFKEENNAERYVATEKFLEKVSRPWRAARRLTRGSHRQNARACGRFYFRIGDSR